MALGRFFASQLRRPSGLFGRFVTARFLNRGNAPQNELTLTLLELAPDDHVLELGFGGGDLIHRMAAVVVRGRIAGVDFSPDMVEVCSRRFAREIEAGQIELRCANAENLPYASEQFTKACTVNTIYFWADPLVPLRELWRVLRAGGRVVVCFSPPATLRKVPCTKHGFASYEPDQVQQLLETAGFRDIRMVPGTSRIGEFLCAVGTR